MSVLRAGDALRRLAGTTRGRLPNARRIDAPEARRLVPGLAPAGLRGALMSWDGQLTDDAALVVAVARTAARFGARILTRMSAVDVSGDRVMLRDELGGGTLTLRARSVLNAAGVWAGEVDPSVRLRPSRGTHLVLDAARLGGSDVSLTVPLPGSRGRVVFTVPAPHGRVYAGLTDVDAGGPVPDVPEPSEAEISMLLDTLSTALEVPLERGDVLGAFAGLRPLLVGPGGDGGGDGAETADLSRRHAILESASGVLSVVGGKLTTYRRMAQDGIDAAITRRGLVAPPSRTRDLPLVGAWPRERLREIDAPPRFVRRYGTEAPAVAGLPGGADAARGVTAQELAWGVLAEGALTVDDLLDRRTRLGLVASDREASLPAAQAALERWRSGDG
jgi:glycerol-3-phosphate dehydrogenase